MDLTYSDVQSILKIIDAAEHLDEIELVHNGFRLHVIRNGGGALPKQARVVELTEPARAAPAAAGTTATAPAVPASQSIAAAVPEGTIAIRAPMLGMFYRAASPGEKPFVEIGQRVRADDTVCLIEVMKLFNSIRAGVDGEVVQIRAENGGLVEFDEVLIVVKPDKG